MKETKPLVSIVIPAYNEEKYLARCLASLAKQTFQQFEIIVVDNNSRDETAAIARSYGARVVAEQKQGMIPARERGFYEALSDIIAKTDADAILPSDWVGKVYRLFKRNPQMVALTGNFSFPETNEAQGKLLEVIYDAYCKQLKLIMGHFPLNGPNYAIRKSAWEKIKVHKDDKLVHEDFDLSCHLFELGEIKYVKNLKVSYSLRRWKRKFWYTMFEYSRRTFRTILIHHKRYKQIKNIVRRKLPKIRKSAGLN